jgi:hypothetical protein
VKNPIIIPEKISIHLLYELLNLSSMQQRAKLDTLKSYSLERDLLLSTYKEVKGLSTNIPLGDIYDENEFIDHHDAKEQDIEEFYLISFKLNQYFLTAEKATTCINWFKVNGKSFHVVNNNNNDVGDLIIDLSDVFVTKSDFINFIDESGDNVLLDLFVDLQTTRTNEACVLTPRQEVLKYPALVEQRYNFLYDWTQNALPSVPFDEFIYGYDEELTKETFYELLSNEYKKNHPNDSNIFIKGADSFYKDRRINLKFKSGRRKNS